MSQGLTKDTAIERLRDEGGVLVRRRGGVSSGYWNNYWTSDRQPSPPAWHLQQNTVNALIRGGQLRVVSTFRGAPNRCELVKQPVLEHG